jgi:hypothetical protein
VSKLNQLPNIIADHLDVGDPIKSITTPKKGGLMVTLKGSNLFPQFTLIQFAIFVLLMPDIAPYLVFV